ncbi:MAG: ABC transporter permease [Lachnospiraceae bacterium]|jgi:D-methionine transport system permease protein|nr:ABC transporter permease [Lachnospiraceae bacterium]MCR5127724.1 ABC transporter permease [Lachnospiraceae bacterium]
MIQQLLPNVFEYAEDMYKAFGETLIMVLISGSIGLLAGLLLGIILVITADGGLYENKPLHKILETVINIFRSIPFVILVALLVSFTRALVGTSIGIKGAIVPMVVGIVPFISRLIEQALLEVDNGVIEAAKAMGISKSYIVFHILIPEARPGLIRSFVTATISLIGLSAMAGTVGGGGIGSFAVRYGYSRYMNDITFVTVVILILGVNIIQSLGNRVAIKISH